eukprot:598897-Pleurochrysis_carterae.AAC.1
MLSGSQQIVAQLAAQELQLVGIPTRQYLLDASLSRRRSAYCSLSAASMSSMRSGSNAPSSSVG